MLLTPETFLDHKGISRQLLSFKKRHQEIQEILSEGKVYENAGLTKSLMIEYKRLEAIVSLEVEHRKIRGKLEECRELLKEEKDSEMGVLVEEEAVQILDELTRNSDELKFLLLPREGEAVKSVVLEIRAGTGGDEASLFVADLFRMYSRIAEKKHWKLEILSHSLTEVKGMKEIIFSVMGGEAYEYLKYETGVHRVQRIPETEASGRIHTSAVTVAVLPEIEEEELEILDKDLKIDTYRASGAGGQHVNTTDSAIRITHLPTQLVVTCQDERSQIKNRSKAMKILRARLYENNRRERKEATDLKRRSQVGSGDRSEKVRTYNFPQGRVSEHRTGLTLYKLSAVLEGDLDEVINSLRQKEVEEKLSTLVNSS